MEKFETYISLADLDKVKSYDVKWYVAWHKNNNSYYARASIYLGKRDETRYKYKLLYLHKLIYDSSNSKDIIDHIDNNTLNNIRTNLRKTNNKDNLKNRSGKNSNNKSGYRNVCWNKAYKMWVVQLQIDGKNKILGAFDDVHEAGKYAERMRQTYYGEFRGRN
ncbi:hypothetical protein AV545_03825 [Paenibacillus jamilae]|uniref:HNH endonuclease n=1 Tax=Paenibacillus jamilae TaxID=114136 RepID=UPI0007ABA88D|nr:HNH endonuclease [Paenibacillus jamilae]KZE65060.1 hypothetical protein AV545_03825 [Paenibacillus jamilae]